MLKVTKNMSPNRHDTDGRKIDLIVIHTMEMAEKGDTAESCANYFKKKSSGVSAHFCVDNNSIVQCVREKDVAWAAPGANSDGLQIEHAGRAAQKAVDWSDTYSKSMLKLSAELAAGLCEDWKIPARFILAPGLAAGLRGVTTHAEVSKAFGLSAHWDPGVNFPIESYIHQIKTFGASIDHPSVKDDEPVLRKGDKGWKVAQAERLLNAASQNIKADGIFDQWTEKAVLGFQKRFGLNPDGVIGPMTWRALWAHRYA